MDEPKSSDAWTISDVSVGRRRFLKGLAVIGASGLVQQACGTVGGTATPRPPGDGTTTLPAGPTSTGPSSTAPRPTTTIPSGPGTTVTTDRPPQVVGPRWSEPSTWPNNRVPKANDTAVINKTIILDTDAVVAGVVVESAGALVFPPTASVMLQSSGNVVLRGKLIMRPASASVLHVLRFLNINEAAFVGGGDKLVASDVGLWIEGKGTLDVAGAPKKAWTRATNSLKAGATQVVVEDTAGWRVGDIVVVTPTTPPSPDNDAFHQDVDHAMTYDEASIKAISGSTVILDTALKHEHPRVVFPDWTGAVKAYGAEVINLTRNVVIEGSPDGRAHVTFMHAASKQSLSHVEIRNVGPRKATGEKGKSESVLGRYGIHFHKCGDATRGSVLEGVVVHDCGGHAFVPHDSHGITLRECVAHDVRDTAFWWDLHERDASYHPATDDSVWDRCLASKVWSDRASAEGYRMAGFYLGEGKDLTNSCIGCVAVGIRETDSTMNSSLVSGFHWPEAGKAIWNFRGCLAHNVGGSGSFTWQNDERVHLLEQFTAYHAGKSGIDHGAYANFWHYKECALFANRRSGLAIHAVTRRTNATPKGSPPLLFEDIVIEGGGLTRWGMQSEGHRFPAPDVDPAVISRARVTGCREAAYYEPPLENRTYLRISDSRMAATEFFLDDKAAPDTAIVVENLNGRAGSFTLRARTQQGALVPEWNAVRS